MKTDECERDVVSVVRAVVVMDEREREDEDAADECEVVAERVLGESCANDMLEDIENSNNNRIEIKSMCRMASGPRGLEV